jgi:hypothetical protein
MKLITLTVLAVMTAFGGLAQPPNSSPPKAAPPADSGLPVALGSVYHDFMERFADENPAWKTEISLAADITRPPSPPYRLNYSDTLGYYSYRVKRWDELSAYEKFAVQHDPRLPHFIREVYGRDLPGATGEETSDATAQATGGGQQAAVAPREEPTTPDVPPNQRIDLFKQTKGVLAQAEGMFVYRFEPDDLLTTKPLRLLEVAPGK